MIEKIGRLGTETAVYGVSTVVGRFLTFLLTPFYANILSPGDLGIVATLYSYIAFLNIVYHYGMDISYMKYVSTLELGNRKETFTVPFVSVAVSSLVFSILLLANAPSVSELVGAGRENSGLVGYAAMILFLDAVSHIPFAALRMNRQARNFASVKLAGIVVNVICAVLFLVEFGMGLEGIFLAGVASSAVTLLLLSPTIIGNLSVSWSRKMFRSLLSYGLPTLPAGLAAIVIQVADRPILESLTDLRTVGIYQANYRLGIFMMLIVSMFEFAWRPFSFAHARDEDAQRLFARVMTYLFLVMAGVFIILFFFLEDLAKAPIFFGYSLLPESYWEGLPVVPVILLAYVFLGISTVCSAGLYIEKKTGILPAIAIAGAVLNVAANWLLIPHWGMHGAAVATLLSYVLMALFMYRSSQRVYHVEYESGRMLRLLVVSVTVCAAGVLITPPIPIFLWRLLLILLFVAGLRWLRFFERSELAAMKGLLSRSTTRDIPPKAPLPGNGN